jgi:hypothetical protein
MLSTVPIAHVLSQDRGMCGRLEGRGGFNCLVASFVHQSPSGLASSSTPPSEHKASPSPTLPQFFAPYCIADNIDTKPNKLPDQHRSHRKPDHHVPGSGRRR